MSSAPTEAKACIQNNCQRRNFKITHSFLVYFYPLLPYFISGIQNVKKVENSNKGMKLFTLCSDIQEAIWIKESRAELISPASYSKKHTNAFRIAKSVIQLNIVSIWCQLFRLSFYTVNKKYDINNPICPYFLHTKAFFKKS